MLIRSRGRPPTKTVIAREESVANDVPYAIFINDNVQKSGLQPGRDFNVLEGWTASQKRVHICDGLVEAYWLYVFVASKYPPNNQLALSVSPSPTQTFGTKESTIKYYIMSYRTNCWIFGVFKQLLLHSSSVFDSKLISTFRGSQPTSDWNISIHSLL